jgi:NNP family nitrate/nitrite transporter-like MFS transporter
MPPFPFPLFPIAFLTAIFFLNFVSRIILGPFLPVVVHELGLGHGAAGSLFSFVQIGYATGLLASGFVSWRLTHRRTITLSSVAMGAAMLALSQARTLGEIHVCLVLVGTGAGLYLPTGIATITELVDERHWGKALALHELAPNLGFITAPLLAEALFAVLSWRGVLGVVGGGALLLGGCFARWGQGGTRRGEAPRLATVHRVVREPSLWVMAWLFGMGVGASLGVYTMIPLFLVSEIGLSRATANTLTGLSRLASLAMILVAGWIADRLGDRRALVLALTVTGTIVLGLGAFTGPAITPVLILFQSASAVLFFPAAFAAVSRLFPATIRHLAISLSSTVGSTIGAGVVPSAIGHMADAVSFSAGLVLIGIVTVLSPLLLAFGGRGASRAGERA